MKITKHAYKRIQQRGMDIVALRIVEECGLSKFKNQSQQIILKKKDAVEISSVLRKTAESVEKHAGVQLVLDDSGSTLITVYRRRA